MQDKAKIEIQQLNNEKLLDDCLTKKKAFHRTVTTVLQSGKNTQHAFKFAINFCIYLF